MHFDLKQLAHILAYREVSSDKLTDLTSVVTFAGAKVTTYDGDESGPSWQALKPIELKDAWMKPSLPFQL